MSAAADLLLAPAVFVATLLCSLVAGFLFGFAVVAMPGIHRLEDGEFVRAFRAMDRVIQDNQPLFLLVWVGSVLKILAAAALGAVLLEGLDRLMLISAAAAYLAGVQAPTVLVNIPLNNRLQALDPDAMDAGGWSGARAAFEARWNRWNRIRTVFAVLTSVLLLGVLWRL